MFTAIINVPGYLPETDPEDFDTAAEAWQFLASIRHGEELDTESIDVHNTEDALAKMLELANPLIWDGRLKGKPGHVADIVNNGGTGVIYANTPGYDGEHDLGLVYVVVKKES